MFVDNMVLLGMGENLNSGVKLYQSITRMKKSAKEQILSGDKMLCMDVDTGLAMHWGSEAKYHPFF